MSTRQINLWLRSLAAVALVLCSPGCASFGGGAPAPDWIDDPPVHDTFLYAVESYVGALHPEDNQMRAMDRARESLARGLRARVRGTNYLEQDDFSSVSETTVLVDSDTVLELSELVDQWVDRSGRVSKRGTVWVLMRVPKSVARG